LNPGFGLWETHNPGLDSFVILIFLMPAKNIKKGEKYATNNDSNEKRRYAAEQHRSSLAAEVRFME
jgi:hypothetical protein